MGVSWHYPGLLRAFLGARGPLLGSPGALLGLSRALLDPSWTPSGPQEAPRSTPRDPQDGSKSHLPEVCLRGLFLVPFRGCLFCHFWLPFQVFCLFIFGSLFWFRFLLPPGCILGPQNAPRGCKTTPPSTQNCLKTMCFFVFFAHRLFRRFDASLCLLGPLLVPTLPLQGPF